MFTPIETSIGAFLLHEATSILLFQNGSVLGVSGFLRELFNGPSRGTLTFFAGMAASYVPLKLFLPELMATFPEAPSSLAAALVTVGIGALVGWGTKLANGCTSGHMLCGMSRLSPYSTAAVATFFPAAMITHHLAHPSLKTDVCNSALPCYTPTYPSRETTTTLILLATLIAIASRTLPKLVNKATSHSKSDRESPARRTTQFLSGLEFGLGLYVTGMAYPSKVLSFLSFPDFENWDPSMGLVILFGIIPNILEIQARGFTEPPSFNDKFEFPRRTISDIDWKLILGSAVFGIGWGLSGACPGPSVLRSISQPVWGLLWMTGYFLGGKACNF
ncbi:YeeE/YedE family integral membrane protein-like protein [Westerdykella ornata]|uniref:YeeE/YedE family integral membrane protein-like protein n=1 Tax=Westerdykella ornata TaxID=318751 RepID=A0A6A6JXV8_WESOR|nr:YeeE/YedE family integral membrane protein-like protein [Westerdykella ornata]KAF2281461.1 YeeE/YedE family integral membrane protein-like protein [Westerdykella ornata]